MRAVKPLPDTVHSTLRSGLVLFDLTSVVEELVFNSVDAGAKKVSVFVGISNCFLKVVDDGSGITRDGLVSLGERYATSKDHQLDDIDSCSGSFGSRGEALASISDIAVLEIITKAPGKPNGYRKVLKGCKCLHLGIDDDRKDAGTSGKTLIGKVALPSDKKVGGWAPSLQMEITWNLLPRQYHFGILEVDQYSGDLKYPASTCIGWTSLIISFNTMLNNCQTTWPL